MFLCGKTHIFKGFEKIFGLKFFTKKFLNHFFQKRRKNKCFKFFYKIIFEKCKFRDIQYCLSVFNNEYP